VTETKIPVGVDVVAPETSTRVAHDFRPDIEGLRAVAIVSVLIFHAHDFIDTNSSGWLNRLICCCFAMAPGGYLGVDVFFVISGFLITGLLVREVETTGRLDFQNFYARRARRILPAATATLVVTVIASLVILTNERAGAAATGSFWASIFSADNYFSNAGTDYMSVSNDPNPVLHFWSLNDEEKFYMLWPLLITLAAVIWRTSDRYQLRVRLIIAMTPVVVGSLLWSQHLVTSQDPSAYFSATSRAFELGFGGLLAVAYPWIATRDQRARDVVATTGLVLILVCFTRYSTLTPFPGLAALPVILLTGLVLIGTPAGPTAWALSTAVPRWFGRISYSLYLWHWPLLVLAAALTISGNLSPVATTSVVSLAIAVSWMAYRFLETPARKAKLLANPRRALLAGLFMIATTALTSLTCLHVAEARQSQQDLAATTGLTFVHRSQPDLLFIGDSITERGITPLGQALKAAGWDARIDALGGRPIVSGKRKTWTPLCFDQPQCGADLVLAAARPAHTIVISLGTNAFHLVYDRVSAPTATFSGLIPRRDRFGHFEVAGQDSPSEVVREVTQIMRSLPSTTQIYWVGIWLDDKNWKNVTWRASNASIKRVADQFRNAHYLDYASYVVHAHIPYKPDGSHPTPQGMALRANWIVKHLS
jgi:peptidoglycan/LPS O-acetylase OafA/YrhL